MNKKLDKLCSEYIRKRALARIGGCERCLTPKFDKQKENGSIFPAWMQLDWAHCWSRRKLSTRYDIDNAAGLCGGCHRYLDDNFDEKGAFFKKLLGEREFELLQVRATRPQKVDINAVTLYLQDRLAKLEGR